ncbi:hypothetical protein QTP88_022912 [Uroleucon formosanum]
MRFMQEFNLSRNTLQTSFANFKLCLKRPCEATKTREMSQSACDCYYDNIFTSCKEYQINVQHCTATIQSIRTQMTLIPILFRKLSKCQYNPFNKSNGFHLVVLFQFFNLCQIRQNIILKHNTYVYRVGIAFDLKTMTTMLSMVKINKKYDPKDIILSYSDHI